MAAIIRETLTSNGNLTFACAGLSKVGFNVSGTWTGTITFKYSVDGINFDSYPQGGLLSVFPFPPVGTGTQVGQSSTTANGAFEVDVKNFVAVRMTFVRTTGSAQLAIGGSLDLSYQEAFLVSTSLFVNQAGGAGLANVVTIAAQANRAWRCRTLSIGLSAAPAAAPLVTISDGGSAILWQEYATASAGTYKVNLPADPPIPGTGSGGVFGTPGNSMVITVAAPGGTVVSQINAEIMPA